MSEEASIIAAIAFELGIPLALGMAFWRVPILRPRLIVILGAVTPPLIFYAAVVVLYLIEPTDPSNRFAFFAGWTMTFFAYVTILVAGILLSVVPKPTRLISRYILGLAPPALTASAFFLQ